MPVRRRRSPSIPVFRRSFFPDCRQVFDRLLQMLRLCGHMTEYDGTQEDFPEKPAAACALPYAMP